MAFKLELKEADFAYEKGRDIVSSASFSVGPGEVLAIAAPVGTGKSTLLKLCAGLLEPVGGRLLIDGRDFWNLAANERSELRHRMGFSFQEAALIANLNVFDNLALPLRYYGEMTGDEISRIINSWLEKLGLVQASGSQPAALSLGVRRKAAFIRAMLLGRDFFFWDDPAQNADPEFAAMIEKEILERKKKGAGQLLTTQNRELLFRTADRALVLDGGRVRFLGPLKDAGL